MHEPNDLLPLDRALEQSHPDLWALAQHWIACAGRDRIPTIADFAEDRVDPWQRHFAIYDTVDNGDDFHVIWEGPELLSITGERWSGHRASEVEARYRQSLLHDLKFCFYSRKPLYSQVRIYQREKIAGKRLMLPLGRDGHNVDRVIIALFLDA